MVFWFWANLMWVEGRSNMSSNQANDSQKKLTSFRRCHLCGCTNEEDHGQTIIRCQHCRKSLAPFYYFNDRSVTPLAEDAVRSGASHSGYQPIQGLTAYW